MVVKQLWTLNSLRALHQPEANLKPVALDFAVLRTRGGNIVG